MGNLEGINYEDTSNNAHQDYCEIFGLPDNHPVTELFKKNLQCTIKETQGEVSNLLYQVDTLPEEPILSGIISENLTIKGYNSLVHQVNNYFDKCKVA